MRIEEQETFKLGSKVDIAPKSDFVIKAVLITHGGISARCLGSIG